MSKHILRKKLLQKYEDCVVYSGLNTVYVIYIFFSVSALLLPGTKRIKTKTTEHLSVSLCVFCIFSLESLNH